MTLFLLVTIAVIIYYFFIYKGETIAGFGPFNRKRCPNCHNPIEENFNVCPVCKETLRKKCSNCGEKISVAWKYCPYCEKSNDQGR